MDYESREDKESYFEHNHFSEHIESTLKKILKNGAEVYPDIVTCPIASCRNPVKIEIRSDEVELVCPNCGWHKIVRK